MKPTALTRSVLTVSMLSIGFMASGHSVHARDARAPLNDDCWAQTFSEDFDELSLWDAKRSDGRWKTSYIWGSDIVINNELQYYVDPRVHDYNPFSIDDGVLSISAEKTPASMLAAVQDRRYVSGVLTTENDFSQKHGRFEVRAQVPAGKGLWSAFWLLPSFESWPDGVAILPEIDVMEHIGDQPNTYHTTLHTNQSGELTSYPYDHTLREDLTRDFHLYSVVWTAEQVHWYLDKQWRASHPTPKDFTRPVHFLLNLAVGGSWPGDPNEKTEFPARYRIDYVRAFSDSGSC